jgi:phage FluMu protein Com
MSVDDDDAGLQGLAGLRNDGRLRCCVCGYDLGDAEDPYRDPSCPRCLDAQDAQETWEDPDAVSIVK